MIAIISHHIPIRYVHGHVGCIFTPWSYFTYHIYLLYIGSNRIHRRIGSIYHHNHMWWQVDVGWICLLSCIISQVTHLCVMKICFCWSKTATCTYRSCAPQHCGVAGVRLEILNALPSCSSTQSRRWAGKCRWPWTPAIRDSLFYASRSTWRKGWGCKLCAAPPPWSRRAEGTQLAWLVQFMAEALVPCWIVPISVIGSFDSPFPGTVCACLGHSKCGKNGFSPARRMQHCRHQVMSQPMLGRWGSHKGRHNQRCTALKRNHSLQVEMAQR